MKARQAKKLKTKTPRVGTKQTKAKLPQYKAKNRLLQGRSKSSLKSLIMNRPGPRCEIDEETTSPRNSRRKEQLVSQNTLKRRRKKYTNKKEAQHSMDLSLQSSNDSKEAQLTRHRDDKQCRDTLEQRNIGSPVIVEALSENLSSLSIPEVFKQSQRTRKENKGRDNAPIDARSMDSEVNETCVLVAESLNPNDNVYDRGNNTTVASPSKTNRKPWKEKKLPSQNNKHKSNINVLNDSRDAEKSAVPEECAEYTSHDSNDERTTGSLETATLCKSDVHSDHSPIRFYSLRNKVVVVMPEKTRFCFNGKLIVRVIYGAIEAYGCVITAESGQMEMYSPRGYSNVLIETSEKFSRNSAPDVWKPLAAEGIHREEKSKLITDIEQIQPGTAVLFLSNLENKLTKFLNIFYPFRLFPKIRNPPHYSWTDPRRAEAVLQSNLYVGNYTCKELITDPRVAQEVADKMTDRWRAKEWSCTLLIGGKSVGKSTTTRYLINSLLPVSKMVVLLDVDPGQTECTPPGCISYSLIEQPLMGPNFTHLKTPVFQLYIGDVNVSRCITRYIEGIKILVDKFTNCPILSRLPIVVNTMGFTHGIGWDIVLFTIKLVRPSFVVQIMSEKPKNNYIGYLSKQVVNRQRLPWASWSSNVINWSQPCDHELIVVRSHAERKSAPGYDSWNMEPYQQRELVTISYLSEIVQNPTNSAPRIDALSLNIHDAVPYVVPFSSLYISIPRSSVPPTHVLNVINGNMVALCGIDTENESWDGEITCGLRVLNRMPLCACYGFGIVRGVDMERGEMFINTPLPISMMQYVNCLMGCVPVPITLLQANRQKNVEPYIGGSDVLPMSREHRRGYFRMRYQNGQNKA